RGDGTFEEVTFQSHLARAYGPGLGVAIADFNLDGWPDIYVANDGKENQMWINHQGQYFQNQAILAGTAVNSEGLAEASMGVNVADFDGDGDEDLFMTHLTRETNTFYRNQGQAAYGLPLFEDQTRITGLAASSIPYTGFGTVDFDFDNDGWLDLFIANGHVGIIQELAEKGDPFPLKQKNQLFRNLGDGHFIQVSSSEDPVFSLMEVSRGVAKGDLDNDGDEDLLLCNNNGPARILQNEVGQNQNWIGFRLIDPEFKRDALGARIALLRSDGVTLWRRVHVDGSYCSAHDPRITIGLGNKGFQKLLVYWPGGPVEEFVDLKINRYHILNKGSGNTIKSP
ncbi:MAG: CRTAC1 family protein, partial [Calditrichaeota bacterium]